MIYAPKRHPFPVVAKLHHTLVLTYAVPTAALDPLLPPGLVADTFPGDGGERDLGFVAVALVQARGMRPVFVPEWLGRDFFLAGYRVFVRFVDR